MHGAFEDQAKIQTIIALPHACRQDVLSHATLAHLLEGCLTIVDDHRLVRSLRNTPLGKSEKRETWKWNMPTRSSTHMTPECQHMATVNVDLIRGKTFFYFRSHTLGFTVHDAWWVGCSLSLRRIPRRNLVPPSSNSSPPFPTASNGTNMQRSTTEAEWNLQTKTVCLAIPPAAESHSLACFSALRLRAVVSPSSLIPYRIPPPSSRGST